jgi:hypothetical protein
MGAAITTIFHLLDLMSEVLYRFPINKDGFIVFPLVSHIQRIPATK